MMAIMMMDQAISGGNIRNFAPGPIQWNPDFNFDSELSWPEKGDFGKIPNWPAVCPDTARLAVEIIGLPDVAAIGSIHSYAGATGISGSGVRGPGIGSRRICVQFPPLINRIAFQNRASV